jgi:post-segregation antitoxin (ccd killing protein)
MNDTKLRLMRNAREEKTEILLRYTDKILDARNKGNFIYAGKIINDARKTGVKLSQLAVITEISTPTLSNWSMINKKATPEMKRWASEGKLGVKALREIVRLPKQYQIPLAEKIIKKEVTINILDELVQHLKTTGININVEIQKLHLDRDAFKKGKLRPQAPVNYLPQYNKYRSKDIADKVNELAEMISSFDSRNLADWEKLGLRPKIKVLSKLLIMLNDNINDSNQMPKM